MNAVAQLPTDPISEANMEGFPMPTAGSGGVWSAAGAAITLLVAGIVWAVGWWRKNGVSSAEADARINSLEDLRNILAAERESHAAEIAALRQAYERERDRADKFAGERNEWMLKFGEMSGELRAVKAELESMRAELARFREQRNGNAQG